MVRQHFRNDWAGRKQIPVLLAFLFVFLGCFRLLAANSFTATLDRNMIYVGQSATLTLKFEGAEPKAFPVMPNISNLQISGGGAFRQAININGQSSSSLVQTFALTPLQPGEYAIPALQATVEGQIVTSQPLKLKAVAAQAAASNSGDGLVFLRVVLPKKEAYLGEVIEAQLQLGVRDGVADGENLLQGFEKFGGAPFKAEGFSVLKTAGAQRQRAQVGSVIYTVATLVTALSPVKTGELTIDSAIRQQVTLHLPIQRQQQRDSVFDPFGMFQRYDEKTAMLAAAPEKLNALPLPKENVPENFNGAVGSYLMTTTASPTNIGVGDPITIKIQITGKGALDSLALPEQNDWDKFKIYPPTDKVETTDPLGLQGAKRFEQVVVPQSADITELPPISFSYFDSDKKIYQTLTQPAIRLIVRPSAASPSIVGTGPRNSADNAPVSQDILPIKQRLDEVVKISPPLAQQTWFLALQSVPVLALAGAVVLRRRNENLANNPRLRRRLRVAGIIRDGLNDLRRLAAENNSEEFFATLFRLLQEQLGERLDLPASAITEAAIEDLRPRGVPEATLDALHELFQTCNLTRYAPVKTSHELEVIIPRFESVVQELQTLKI